MSMSNYSGIYVSAPVQRGARHLTATRLQSLDLPRDPLLVYRRPVEAPERRDRAIEVEKGLVGFGQVHESPAPALDARGPGDSLERGDGGLEALVDLVDGADLEPDLVEVVPRDARLFDAAQLAQSPIEVVQLEVGVGHPELDLGPVVEPVGLEQLLVFVDRGGQVADLVAVDLGKLLPRLVRLGGVGEIGDELLVGVDRLVEPPQVQVVDVAVVQERVGRVPPLRVAVVQERVEPERVVVVPLAPARLGGLEQPAGIGAAGQGEAEQHQRRGSRARTHGASPETASSSRAMTVALATWSPSSRSMHLTPSAARLWVCLMSSALSWISFPWAVINMTEDSSPTWRVLTTSPVFSPALTLITPDA